MRRTINFLKTSLIAFSLAAVFVPMQDAKAQKIYGDPLSDVTLVAGCAVGGAVLGLSTLPFTDEPGDHLDNILVGGAIGLIIGVALVAYVQSSDTPSQFEKERPAASFTFKERKSLLSQTDISKLNQTIKPQVGYSFRF